MTNDFASIDEYYICLRGNGSAKKLQNGWIAIKKPFVRRHDECLVYMQN